MKFENNLRRDVCMKRTIELLMLCFIVVIVGCTDDNVYIPFYQDAIYIMDSDGNNKQKVMDIDSHTNVQFIPNSNKILFMTSRNDDSQMKQIHTVNINGSDSLQISGDYLLKDEQPAVSDDGTRIVFWALHQFRDYAYDLYMTDPLGTEIVNLTNTEDESEKDASFIQYQEQEYLLYVTYFNDNNINYSTISMMNTETFSIDTLYVEEIYDDWGFKNPAYHLDMDLLFVAFGKHNTYVQSNLLLYNGLMSSNYTILYEGIYSYRIKMNYQYNKLIFKTSDIMIYDMNLNQFNILYSGGYTYDSFDEYVIYCTGFGIDTSEIYSINLNGTENTLLADDGFYPRYSPDGSQIVYIGRHLRNQKRNLITN